MSDNARTRRVRAAAAARFYQKLDTVDPQQPSRESALVAAAKHLAKLQLKRAALRRALRENERESRRAKQALRALLAAPGPDTPIVEGR